MPQIDVRPLGGEYYPRLVEIWAAAVRATHHFLEEEDFKYFHARIASDYLPNVTLYGAFAAGGAQSRAGCLGFIGLAREAESAPLHVEMLFVDPPAHRRGVGRALLNLAKGLSGEVLVDVNEQNQGAVNFYLREGFEVIGHSPLDPSGKAYPLLHMCLI